MNQLLPYFRLLRLPNVFTAMADIVLGALAAGALPQQWVPFVLLLAASSCLYCSGMVWNDYFDIEQDKRQRPFRPLPSGRISLRTALRLALVLMAAGIGCAALADLRGDGFRGASLLVALLLGGSILLYDGWLKRTPLGPVAMGACRLFNVLLGLTTATTWVGNWGILLALVVGIYIAGVTWFARTEAEISQQGILTAAALVMLSAIILALALPVVGPVSRDEDTNLPAYTEVQIGQLLFPYLLVAFAIYIGSPILAAIRHPVPDQVQAAVKRCLFGLVLLDAILATVFVGPLGLLLLLLLLPASYLGRWVYST